MLTLYVNTTLVVPLFSLTNPFLARKCPAISLFENLFQYDHLLLWSYNWVVQR